MTIGYEGAALEDFLAALTEAGVRRLLDIRELPNSRRRGISKSALSAALREAGIEYFHERALGSPPEMRQRLRAERNPAECHRSVVAAALALRAKCTVRHLMAPVR